MLKYFKKQKSQCATDERNEKSSVPNKRDSLRSTSSFCEVFLNGDDDEQQDDDDTNSCGSSIILPDEEIFKYQSRLSISLSALVNVPNCLSYFVQYLETKNGALSLLKFYLDIENFKTSALSQLERRHDEQWSRSETNAKCSTKKKQKFRDEAAAASVATTHNGGQSQASNEERDDKNAVPELKTLCDLSMRKPLTDDEKSQIYAETSKQMQTKICGKKEAAACSGSITSLTKMASDSAPQSLELANCVVTEASIQDALAIYQKYLVSTAKEFVCLPLAILSNLSLLLCRCSEGQQKDKSHGETVRALVDEEHKATEDNVTISAYCFDEAQHWIFGEIERLYLNGFLQSTHYCKYCIELIEGSLDEVAEDGNELNRNRLQSAPSRRESNLTIYDILYSETTLFFFMEFLEQNDERKCLDFWTTAINYRQSFVDEQASTGREEIVETLKADAMVIYDKFFSLQADSRLWISDKLRLRVEELICASPDQLPYCFDLPLFVTAKYLERKYFAAFLRSQLFENYLNELKAKVNEEPHGRLLEKDAVDGESQKTRLQRTLSLGSSEGPRDFPKSISQHNTLLAMDSSSRIKQLQSTGTNLSIDSRHFTNPDLLWRRSHAGLKFGHVNSLGKFERDFDTVENLYSGDYSCGGGGSSSSSRHSWSIKGSKIKNAIRKLVHLPEEKAQEEIAWQVAEMIVKDVTSVTLQQTGAGSDKGRSSL